MAVAFMFPQMLADHVKNQFPLPPNPCDFEPAEYPHWHVFLVTCLGTPYSLEALDHNAKILGEIPVDELKVLTYEDLIAKGFEQPSPVLD